MEATDKKQLTLTRIQFIADVSQVARCTSSEFLIAMALISDLAQQASPNENYEEIFYRADDRGKH